MTSSFGTAAVAPANVIDKLKAASSAEDFFMLLGVGYDQKSLDVARLHILKRMGEYLAFEDFKDLADRAVAARCSAVLLRAYDDFVASRPLDQRVFKVLKDAVAPPKRSSFVPFETLLKESGRRSPAER